MSLYEEVQYWKDIFETLLLSMSINTSTHGQHRSSEFLAQLSYDTDDVLAVLDYFVKKLPFCRGIAVLYDLVYLRENSIRKALLQSLENNTLDVDPEMIRALQLLDAYEPLPRKMVEHLETPFLIMVALNNCVQISFAKIAVQKNFDSKLFQKSSPDSTAETEQRKREGLVSMSACLQSVPVDSPDKMEAYRHAWNDLIFEMPLLFEEWRSQTHAQILSILGQM